MSQKKAIKQLIDHYFEGLYYGNTLLLGACFYQKAILYGHKKGIPYQKSLDNYLKEVAQRQSPFKRGEIFQMQVLNIDVTDTMAVAKLQVPMLGFQYIDYLSLSKIEDRWYIVNKLFTSA